MGETSFSEEYSCSAFNGLKVILSVVKLDLGVMFDENS